LSLRTQSRYRWLDRFITGGLSFDWQNRVDVSAHAIRLGWHHQQSFSSRTNFNANLDYASNVSVIQNNTVNPYLATASLGSSLNFTKRFDWGTLNIGGTRRQDVGNGLVSQSFPNIALTPSPVNITPSITWSPGFSFNNQQSFHQADARLLTPGAAGAPDTLALFADSRQSQLSFQTPLRVGPWNWSNSFQVSDQISTARKEFVFDSTAPAGARRALYDKRSEPGARGRPGTTFPASSAGRW